MSSKPLTPLAEALAAIIARAQTRVVEALAPEPEVPAQSLVERARGIGVPQRLANALVDVDAKREAVRESLAFVQPDDTRAFLVLAGPTGVGKSLAAAFAAVNFTQGEFATRWVRGDESGECIVRRGPGSAGWLHAFRLIQAGTFDRETWARALTPRLLVLDELGGEPMDGKGQALAAITNLLGVRESEDKKTLITTNATWEQFRAVYTHGPGQRTFDRMRGNSRDCFLNVEGKSLRPLRLEGI